MKNQNRKGKSEMRIVNCEKSKERSQQQNSKLKTFLTVKETKNIPLRKRNEERRTSFPAKVTKNEEQSSPQTKLRMPTLRSASRP